MWWQRSLERAKARQLDSVRIKLSEMTGELAAAEKEKERSQREIEKLNRRLKGLDVQNRRKDDKIQQLEQPALSKVCVCVCVCVCVFFFFFFLGGYNRLPASLQFSISRERRMSCLRVERRPRAYSAAADSSGGPVAPATRERTRIQIVGAGSR